MVNLFGMENKEVLRVLLNECIETIKQLQGGPCSDRVAYSADIFKRQVLATYSIWGICDPCERPELPALRQGGTMQDFSSAYVLLRSMYETVITSFYILLSSEFAICRNVVIDVAGLHSLRERYKLLQNMKSKAPETAILVKQMPDLQKSILEHKQFQNLPKRIRRYVEAPNDKNGTWHRLPTVKMAEIAGIHETHHLGYYKYFSNYTHAAPLSLEQIGAVRTPSDAERMISTAYDHAVNFLSRALFIHRATCDEEDLGFAVSELAACAQKFWTELNATEFGTLGSDQS